jgi:Fis family transcriptional regulator, factor for inversion stimulation protein
MNSIEATEGVLDQQASLVSQKQPLRNSVEESLESYFSKLGSAFVDNLYGMVLSEIEAPLLEAVMAYTKGNQSKAAIALGISRGTLRKKLKIYGMLK